MNLGFAINSLLGVKTNILYDNAPTVDDTLNLFIDQGWNTPFPNVGFGFTGYRNRRGALRLSTDFRFLFRNREIQAYLHTRNDENDLSAISDFVDERLAKEKIKLLPFLPSLDIEYNYLLLPKMKTFVYLKFGMMFMNEEEVFGNMSFGISRNFGR